jgi:hypothetical protein
MRRRRGLAAAGRRSIARVCDTQPNQIRRSPSQTSPFKARQHTLNRPELLGARPAHTRLAVYTANSIRCACIPRNAAAGLTASRHRVYPTALSRTAPKSFAGTQTGRTPSYRPRRQPANGGVHPRCGLGELRISSALTREAPPTGITLNRMVP